MESQSSTDYPSEEFFSPEKYVVDYKKSLAERIFPGGFKEEAKSLLIIFFPIVLTSLFRILNPMISLIMCGHLSTVEFDAASLANSLINIFGVSIDLGFSTAFDTLFAQIYGSDQKKKMGSLLQRAMVVMTILYMFLACFHIIIEPVLILLKQDPFISELTAYYIILYLPGLFFDFQFLTMSRYLQNQNILYPMMISSFLGNVFSGISQYVAIYVYGYKLEASAVLQATACFVMFIIQLGYILISRVYKETWNGFSLRDCLDNWKILFALGIPGILMIALEEWNFEIATFVAGSINGTQLGAQSIAFQVSTVAFMVTMGLSIATGIRVGQFLGSREIENLQTSYRTAFVIGMITSTTSCILILSLRTHISSIFSNNKDIQQEGSNLLIYIACLQYGDLIAGITAGILKACGRQVLGACTMFACYYIIGVPIALVLVYVAKINIQGMWIGLMLALVIEGIVFSILVYRTDWNIECNKAIANVKSLDFENSIIESENEKRPLIVKSDYEGDAYWVREKIYKPHLKIKKIKRARSKSEMFTMPTNRSRSMMVYQSKYHDIDTDQPLRKLILNRSIIVIVAVALVVSSLMIRIYLPRSCYLPCIKVTNESLIFYKNRPNYLCQLNPNATSLV